MRIAACISIPFALLFAGLSPEYTWAIPLAIGSFIIIAIFCWGDFNERKHL